MKQISLLIFLGLAFSLCNLSNKLRNANKTNEPATASTPGSASTSRGDSVERPNPTAAQITALAGGQEVKWDQQGITFTVPPKWTEATNETKMLVWRSPGSWDAASLIVNIS
ncbi:MAG TPA: hypothetical protein VJ180_02675, partial [Pyrinomonadaceae bacterium]|nr:hypothetical protein [Pyrinomonadaceae bacterium]